jgi:hypothetical protein
LPERQLNYGRLNYIKEHITKQVSLQNDNLIVGWILINDEKDDLCSKTLETLKNNNLADGLIEFKSGKEITEMYEMFDGPMEGSVGYFNPASVFPLLFVIALTVGLGKCGTSYFSGCVRRSTPRCKVPFRNLWPSNFLTL